MIIGKFVPLHPQNQYIVITEQKATFIADNEKDANIEFVKTQIDKKQITEILGQDGTITIKDGSGNVVDTQTVPKSQSEDGNEWY